MSLVPVLGRHRQVNLYECEASLIYRARSRTAKTTQRNPFLKKKKRKKRKERKSKPVNSVTGRQLRSMARAVVSSRGFLLLVLNTAEQ